MLTDSNDGAKLGLFVLITVDGDGVEEGERENCEERERYRAEESSASPPHRATIRTKVHGKGEVESMLDVLMVRGCLSDARVAGT